LEPNGKLGPGRAQKNQIDEVGADSTTLGAWEKVKPNEFQGVGMLANPLAPDRLVVEFDDLM